MSDNSVISQTWVASGPAGVIASVHRIEEGFTFRLLGDKEPRGIFPTIEVAKNALYSALPPGSDWPDFTEH